MAKSSTLERNQKWVAFNFMPGGNIVVQHFENHIRQKKQGDGATVDVIFKTNDLIAGFKKEPQVAINIKGKITKNEVLVYDGPDLSYQPNAADVVIEWAKSKGLEPVRMAAGQKGDQPRSYEYDQRISKLENDVQDIKGDLGKILDAVTTKAPVVASEA